MIGVVGFLEIPQVATYASRRGPFVFPACMARVAFQRSVHSRQGKSRKPQVIKRDALPVSDGMALLTLSRETRSHVVRRSGLLERSLVT
jgi:hypothetical protein